MRSRTLRLARLFGSRDVQQDRASSLTREQQQVGVSRSDTLPYLNWPNLMNGRGVFLRSDTLAEAAHCESLVYVVMNRNGLVMDLQPSDGPLDLQALQWSFTALIIHISILIKIAKVHLKSQTRIKMNDRRHIAPLFTPPSVIKVFAISTFTATWPDLYPWQSLRWDLSDFLILDGKQ